MHYAFSGLASISLVFAGAASALAQGSLTPPAGPAPTMKTLDQVEARIIVNASNTPGDASNTFIIAQPGSYYLTGNVTGSSGKHGISVRADNVTLDLNGYAIISGGGGAFRGVNVPSSQLNLSIRNGSVVGWTDGGIRAEAAVILAEKLRLANNTGAIGLGVGNGSIVRDCVASGNGTGFSGSDRSQFISCIATLNSSNGFNCTSFVTILDCTANRNLNAGINAQGSCIVGRCHASRNLYGILAGSGSSVEGCVADTNDGSGIVIDTGSTVRNCVAQGNALHGIGAGTSCHVIGNTCDQNNQGNGGGSGILISGNGNRVEANSTTSNNGGFGIHIFPGANNLVVRNSSHGNAAGGNYAFTAGNRYGAIIDLTANNPSTVSGNSAASSLATTDPWANFAY